jgi:hypothetical protein
MNLVGNIANGITMVTTDSLNSNSNITWQNSTGQHTSGIGSYVNHADRGNLEFLTGGTTGGPAPTTMRLTGVGDLIVGETGVSTGGTITAINGYNPIRVNGLSGDLNGGINLKTTDSSTANANIIWRNNVNTGTASIGNNVHVADVAGNLEFMTGGIGTTNMWLDSLGNLNVLGSISATGGFSGGVTLPTIPGGGPQQPKVTTDAYGRVISSAALVFADLPDFGGHIVSTGSTPASVTLASGAASVVGTDTKGVITINTSGTGGAPVILTFALAYATAPVCVATVSGSGVGAVTAGVNTTTTTLIFFSNFSNWGAGTKINYICIQ